MPLACCGYKAMMRHPQIEERKQGDNVLSVLLLPAIANLDKNKLPFESPKQVLNDGANSRQNPVRFLLLIGQFTARGCLARHLDSLAVFASKVLNRTDFLVIERHLKARRSYDRIYLRVKHRFPGSFAGFRHETYLAKTQLFHRFHRFGEAYDNGAIFSNYAE